MSYALVVAGTITSEGVLPASARRLDTGEWVMGLGTAPTELVQACGYLVVADTARPADTATHTYDRTLTLVAGVPTVTWVQRAKTQPEIDQATANTNQATLTQRAETALASNDTYLAIGSPTNAQNLAQIRLLTRECNGLIRLLVGRLESVNNT